MKTNQSLVLCYEDFLALCSTYRLSTKKYNFEKLKLFEWPGVFEQLPFGISIIDYSSGQYLYLSHNSEEILSYSKMDYNQGLQFQYSKMLPEDQHIFNKDIFPDILRFLSSISSNEFEQYRFSFTYRYYRKDGFITNLLQHSTYLEPDPFGKPILNRVIFSDITNFKADSEMSLTIAYQSKDKGFIPVFKKRYNSQPKNIFSGRELEILQLSHQGLSSKLIADKLFLSIHTIKNYKRHMMERTSSKNITGLINFALKNRVLI